MKNDMKFDSISKFVSNLKGSHSLGLYMVYMFLAVIGAFCELSAVNELKEVGLILLLFAGLAVFIHGIIVVVLGGLLYRDWEMIAIVSQANVGGAASAPVVASAFSMGLAPLGVLLAVLGYALGTYGAILATLLMQWVY